ncbi:MAG: anti-sigma factor RsiW [Planctomycetota bacterium]|jgi:anti-sigma factor RsiW
MNVHNPNQASSPEAEPTEDELLAMAYADGEMSPEEAVGFETRMEAEPRLVHRVAEHHALDVLARRLSPPEPADRDWAALQLDPLYRGTVGIGWILLIVATTVSFALAVWAVATNEGISYVYRGLILSSLLGFTLLFLSVVWRRIRAIPLDPYRHIER